MKIGILNVEGALPLFEDFGNLPTHIMNKSGMVNGVKAHKVLDGLIIPGGSLVESRSIGSDVRTEINKLARNGFFILGMCSGFQLLANKTDIGRRSPCPVEREGLGLLDVSFSPMISNDRIEAEIVDNSFLTQGMINQRITGFHCHTYGNIKGEASPVCYSLVKHTDYKDNPRKVLSGVKNDEGNVVGVMVHGSLDENEAIVQNILSFIDATEEDVEKLRKDNKVLVEKIKGEIGVNTGIKPHTNLRSHAIREESSNPRIIMMAGTGTDSGKTFLTTGITGVLQEKGYNTCVLKVGPDIRDIVPSLYLNKEKMEFYSSIEIGGLGWRDLKSVLNDVKNRDYDIVLVEGVMSIFTGMLNTKTPFSSAEIAIAGDMPVILASACDKGGIETAAVDIVSHVEVMTKLGVNVKGVILNGVYDKDIAVIAKEYIKSKTGLEFVETVPKVKLEKRGNIPEVELKLDKFCLNAMKTVDKYLDVNKFLELGDKPEFKGYLSYDDVLNKFK